MTVSCWKNPSDWCLLKSSWKVLESDRCPFRSWELFESRIDDCSLVLEFRLHHQTVAILPLKRTGYRTYATLCTRDFNYMCYVCDPKVVKAVAIDFSNWLSLHGSIVLFKGLRSWSELDTNLSGAMQESCHATTTFQVPVLQVTEEALTECYFSKQRKHHTLRRRERKLEKIGKVELVELHVSELGKMTALHEKRWKTRRDTSGLSDLKKQEWLTSIWQKGGDSFHIHSFGLKVNGQLIAFQFDFEMEDGVIGYWTGFDPDYSPYAPGFLLLEKSLRHWKESGKKWVDFSVGYEAYKNQWASRKVWAETILCSPHKWKLGYQRFLLHHHLLHRLKSSPEVVQWVRNHGKFLKWIQ